MHPDFDEASYFKKLNEFMKSDLNNILILDLKCYLKDFIDKLIAHKLIENSTEQLFTDIENGPIEFYKINSDKIEDKLKDQNETILKHFRSSMRNASIKIDQIESER